MFFNLFLRELDTDRFQRVLYRQFSKLSASHANVCVVSDHCVCVCVCDRNVKDI